jgi:hypothetical protein
VSFPCDFTCQKLSANLSIGTLNQAETSHKLFNVGIISPVVTHIANNCLAVSLIPVNSKGVFLAKSDNFISIS